MKDLSTDIIAAARRWVGTPYQHQQRMKGVGCDCVNLVIAVGLELGILDWTPESFSKFRGYTRSPNPARMRLAMETFLVQLPEGEQPQPGDILWIEWARGLPMHLAIVTGPTMIHAFSDAQAVVEHGVDELWLSRVNSVWRFPGVVK